MDLSVRGDAGGLAARKSPGALPRHRRGSRHRAGRLFGRHHGVRPPQLPRAALRARRRRRLQAAGRDIRVPRLPSSRRTTCRPSAAGGAGSTSTCARPWACSTRETADARTRGPRRRPPPPGRGAGRRGNPADAEPPDEPPLEATVRCLARTASALAGVADRGRRGRVEPGQHARPRSGPSQLAPPALNGSETLAAPGGAARQARRCAWRRRAAARAPDAGALAAPPPRATYRLQFHKDFTFDDAAAIVPYLAQLGVSHVYASPIARAAARLHPRLRHRRPRGDQPGTGRGGGLPPPLGCAAFARPRPRARHRAEPHGRGRIR